MRPILPLARQPSPGREPSLVETEDQGQCDVAAEAASRGESLAESIHKITSGPFLALICRRPWRLLLKLPHQPTQHHEPQQ